MTGTSPIHPDTRNGTGDMPLVCVLGMHRSGTSAVTRALALLGGYPLPAELLDSNAFNASGFWEPRALVDLDDALLDGVSRIWFDPKPVPFDPVAPPPLRDAIAPRAEAVLDALLFRDGARILKDPRLCRTFAILRTRIERRVKEVQVVVPLRHPVAVAASLRRSAGLHFEHAVRLWLTYNLELERATRGLPRVVVPYDALLADWRSALLEGPVAETLGLGDVAADRHARLDAFLSADARHYSASPEDTDRLRVVAPAAARLYDTMRRDARLEDISIYDGIWTSVSRRWAAESPGEGPSEFAERDADLQNAASRKAFEAGDIATALLHAHRALEYADGAARYVEWYGHLLLEARCHAQARDALRKAADLQPDREGALNLLARAERRLGNPEGVSAAYEESLARNPDQPVTLIVLARHRLNQGDTAEARRLFDMATAMRADLPKVDDLRTRIERAEARLASDD